MGAIELLKVEIPWIVALFFTQYRWMPPLLLSVYAILLPREAHKIVYLWHNTPNALNTAAIFAGLTALAWVLHPLQGMQATAVLLQLGSYSLLLRSQHLAFTWALIESGAITGYFLAAGSQTENRWQVALRYLIWSVMGSALILLGVALRAMEGGGLTYPLKYSVVFADALMSWGWSMKVGFIPWHAWVMSLYKGLPVVWAGWFAVVPKGALLLSCLELFPSQGEGPSMGLFYLLASVSLIAGYAVAWNASTPVEMLYWGTFSQAGYMALSALPGGKSGWSFWQVYGIASFLSLLFTAQPWTSRGGLGIGLLLLANLAALPPVMGFWVKLALFWDTFMGYRSFLQGITLAAAGVATIGGFALYGKILWRLAQQEATVPQWGYRVLYMGAALGLLGIGLMPWLGR
ncbi:MAG: hypothetical protein NZ580_07490 [Bacteroidia bacterium]|nr:hypothetical protein [Bacteroidia bacterium]MDW8235941.1 hypothetical protein [Bacteroidia bacterium]